MRWIEITANDKLFGNLWLQVEERIARCLICFMDGRVTEWWTYKILRGNIDRTWRLIMVGSRKSLG